MYDATVTIFNYYKSNSAAVWYPHVLSDVHLETDRGQIIKKYGPVSSVGCMNGKEKKSLFLAGYKEMVRRLQPETIIFYGNVPDECMGNIVRIKAFQDKFKEAKCNGW